MRLRNKPWATEYIMENPTFVIQNPEYYKGQCGKMIFKNNNPLNIEIGSDKGGFIITLAKKISKSKFFSNRTLSISFSFSFKKNNCWKFI